LTIGITGHRDIAPAFVPSLRRRFSAILDDFGRRYPHTPLVVVTALGPGADVLAAEVASSLGIPVVALLPSAPVQYQQEFALSEERERFDAALARCSRVEVASTAADPARRYLESGLQIAYYSHILIAFWDGKPGRGEGDTADIAEARLDGFPARRAAAADRSPPPDIGPVFQILTPRGGTEGVDVGDLVTRYPQRFSGDECSERDFEQGLRRLDQFNADLLRFSPSHRQQLTIEDLCERTSSVATSLQSITFRFLYILYLVALVGTALQFATSQFWRFAMFPIAFVAYRIAKHFDYENRYQDYRTLGEGLRVQAAWFRGGLSAEHADSAYLGMQERELQWIRMALRYAYFAFRPTPERDRADASGCRAWIEAQRRYFEVTPQRESRALSRLSATSRAAFWLSIAVSATILIFVYGPAAPSLAARALSAPERLGLLPTALSGRFDSLEQSARRVQRGWDATAATDLSWTGRLHAWSLQPAIRTRLTKLPATIFALYAAIALLISNYGDKRGFEQNVRRYNRMFAVFDRARRRLDTIPEDEPEEARRLIRELGRAALIENADWLLTRRERPIAFLT
jgi:hypothetical protein